MVGWQATPGELLGNRAHKFEPNKAPQNLRLQGLAASSPSKQDPHHLGGDDA